MSEELGQRAGVLLLQSGSPLAAALVFGEVARIAPQSAGVWCGLGSAVARCVGILVVAPFVRWSTRCLRRSLILEPHGPYAEAAREGIAAQMERPGFEELPPMDPGELPELLAFLDIEPDILVDAIDRLSADDRMFAVMAIGDLRSARFVRAMAIAVSGRWGGGPARSALKRVGPFLETDDVVAAMVSLRASPLAEECDPYLSWAEARLARSEDER
jgi:hypothetical protein